MLNYLKITNHQTIYSNKLYISNDDQADNQKTNLLTMFECAFEYSSSKSIKQIEEDKIIKADLIDQNEITENACFLDYLNLK